MSRSAPLVILDDDDEDEIQITAVTVCAKNRVGSKTLPPNGVPSQQTGNSSINKVYASQQKRVPGKDGREETHSIPTSRPQWLQPGISSEIINSSPPPASSPTPDNPSQQNHMAPYGYYPTHPATSYHRASDQATSNSNAEQALSNPVFNIHFFTDMADTIAHIFPYGAFAHKHNCSVEDVSRALIAVVVDPLMKSNEINEGGDDGCDVGDITRGQRLFDKWNERYQGMVNELRRESEERRMPMEFGEILAAANMNMDAYWTARNRELGVDADKGIQELRRELEAVVESEENHQEKQQQQEEGLNMLEKGGTEVIALEEKEASLSRKRARSSSTTLDGNHAVAGEGSRAISPSPSAVTSATLQQPPSPSPSPSKKAKTTAILTTPTATAREFITPAPQPDQHQSIPTDGSSDLYTHPNLPIEGISNNKKYDSIPIPSPSHSASQSPTPSYQSSSLLSSPSASLSPSPSPPCPSPSPYPQPRSRSLPPRPITALTPSRAPSYFTRPTTRHAVTIDAFGNYQRKPQPPKSKYQLPPRPVSHDDTLRLPGPGLSKFRKRSFFPQKDSAAAAGVVTVVSADDCSDRKDEYYHAGVDKTERVFSGALWEGLVGGLGMRGKGKEDGGVIAYGLELGRRLELARKMEKGKERIMVMTSSESESEEGGDTTEGDGDEGSEGYESEA
ncbi:hypothetical protein AJ79_08963 [Helicocarpus griseus UAMH5409]|uniref:Uncharacterized protein n=1 Tax=Helicocarpus griseus UAMH5409 TaxID=1447875 RepID=A0A2B7WNP0_9EURO|nr:hypothetical protein AJ79_08963 [Helicocarpus griseus UAMH5409]